MNGLESVTQIGGLSLFLNETLSICAAKIICNYLAVEGYHIIGANDSGCNNAHEIVEACLVIHNEDLVHDRITVFPNPVVGWINIEGINLGDAEVILYDSPGQIKTGVIKNGNQINFNGLANGMYLLIIKTSKEKFITRISKI